MRINSLQLESERLRKGGKNRRTYGSMENDFKEDDNDKVARDQSLTSAIFREIMEDNGRNQYQSPLSEFQKKIK